MWAQRTALVLLMALGASSEFQGLRSLLKQQKPAEEDYFEEDVAANPDAVRAEVYGNSIEENPSMELLRFVTGYATGLNSLVDVTPYTPLFMKPLGLKMYGAIEGKNNPASSSESAKTIYYQNNADLNFKNLSAEELDTCTKQQDIEGHGWSLSADLIFFKYTKAAEADPDGTRAAPREILSLASGYHSTHALGAVTMHGGKTDNLGRVVTDDNIDLTGVTHLEAYNCEDGPGVVTKAAMGDYIAAKAEKFYQDGKDSEKVERLAQDVAKHLLDGKLVPVTPIRVDDPNHGAPVLGKQNVEAFFDENEVKPAKDMPVYFADDEVYSTFNVDMDAAGSMRHLDRLMPFKKVGVVVWVEGNKMGLKIDEPCHPKPDNDYKVKLVVPRSMEIFNEVTEFIQSAIDLGKLRASVDFGVSATTEQQRFHLPETDKFGSLKLPEVKPMMSQTGNYPGAVPIPQSGERIVQKEFEFVDAINKVQKDAPVCVVAERKSGRVIERKFDTPLMEKGDRTILKATITGSESPARKYQLRLNDQEPITFSEWRDNCNHKAINREESYQAESGACPGQVEPGLTADVTDYLKYDHAASNTMALDILVWDQESEHYVPYTNIKGWLFNEEASLMVSISLHVYDRRIGHHYEHKSEHEMCSETELQLHNGVGANKGKLGVRSESRTPIPVKEETSLLQRQAPKTCSSYKFESSAPFYETQASALDSSIMAGNAIRVPVLKEVLIQGNERYHTAPLNLLEIPFHWRHVGLQLRIKGPGGEVMGIHNHLPRVGSVGLEFSRDSEAINIHDVQEPHSHPGLEAGASRVGILGALLATLFALVA